MDSQLEEKIRVICAHNASKYEGKANMGAIIGKLIQDMPEIKAKLKELQGDISRIIKEVEALGVEKQLALVQEHAPELLEKKVKERDIFASLGIVEGSKVVTGFPPEPSKYPHIGHAKSALLNYKLAKRFGGRFLLRFDDTNPDLAKDEFYEIHKENYKWLGIDWDSLECASAHMETFYTHTEMLLASQNAYVCTCDAQTTQDNRAKMATCACRDLPAKTQMDRYETMKTAAPGSMVIRLRIDMSHKNALMRDPAIMRINPNPHCKTGTKYRLWPMYDFETSLMDGLMGITHRIRTKEFEMRKELHHHIQRLFNFPTTTYFDIARFNMVGVESSGRIIRERIAQGEFCGWDDPRLTTLNALRRRGFHPQAIENFVISTGMTKNEATLTWDDLIVHNKRYLEEHADRYFFVEDPQQIRIEGAPKKEVVLNLHPDHRKGGRTLTFTNDVVVTAADLAQLGEGKVHRLMECCNIERSGAVFRFHSSDVESYRGKGGRILHWLPADTSQSVPVHIRMNDGTLKQGVAEKTIAGLEVGDIIQFERFGFCRFDQRTQNGTMIFWYTHN